MQNTRQEEGVSYTIGHHKVYALFVILPSCVLKHVLHEGLEVLGLGDVTVSLVATDPCVQGGAKHHSPTPQACSPMIVDLSGVHVHVCMYSAWLTVVGVKGLTWCSQEGVQFEIGATVWI